MLGTGAPVAEAKLAKRPRDPKKAAAAAAVARFGAAAGGGDCTSSGVASGGATGRVLNPAPSAAPMKGTQPRISKASPPAKKRHVEVVDLTGDD